MSKNRYKQSAGLSLIEYVIYIGIVALVLVASITFAWVIINDQTKQTAIYEVNEDGNLVLDKVSNYLQRADNIDSTTIYSTNPGTLVLNFDTNPQITFDTYQKIVTLGDETVTTTKLRMQEGVAAAVDITSDKVDVTNFVIEDITNTPLGGTTTVQIYLTLSSVNPSSSKAYDSENSWTITSTPRKH